MVAGDIVVRILCIPELYKQSNLESCGVKCWFILILYIRACKSINLILSVRRSKARVCPVRKMFYQFPKLAKHIFKLNISSISRTFVVFFFQIERHFAIMNFV